MKTFSASGLVNNSRQIKTLISEENKKAAVDRQLCDASPTAQLVKSPCPEEQGEKAGQVRT